MERIAVRLNRGCFMIKQNHRDVCWSKTPHQILGLAPLPLDFEAHTIISGLWVVAGSYKRSQQDHQPSFDAKFQQFKSHCIYRPSSTCLHLEVLPWKPWTQRWGSTWPYQPLSSVLLQPQHNHHRRAGCIQRPVRHLIDILSTTYHSIAYHIISYHTTLSPLYIICHLTSTFLHHSSRGNVLTA